MTKFMTPANFFSWRTVEEMNRPMALMSSPEASNAGRSAR
jgi:hypothetical protein